MSETKKKSTTAPKTKPATPEEALVEKVDVLLVSEDVSSELATEIELVEVVEAPVAKPKAKPVVEKVKTVGRTRRSKRM